MRQSQFLPMSFDHIARLILSLLLGSQFALLAGAAGPDPALHPCPLADADLWVLAGQSNMEGNGHLTTPSALNPRIMLFNMDNRWLEAREPIHRPYESVDPIHRRIFIEYGGKAEEFDRQRELSKKSPVGGVGPALAFAQHLVENTTRSIGLIPCAHGGTDIASWSPALKDKGGDSLYGSMLGRIRMTGGKVKGVLWYQGETEAILLKSAGYEQAMLDLVDAIRRDTGQPDLPFLYVQIAKYYIADQTSAGSWEQIREIQRQVAKKRKNLYMVSAADLPLDDPIHLSAAGQQRLGRRLAEVALSEVYHRPGHAHPIDLASVKLDWDAKGWPFFRLHFSGVSGRLTACGRPADFELRSDPPTPTAPMIYRTDFDPQDPAGLILRAGGPTNRPMQLIYGSGLHPYLNIVDEKDLALPAFGPIKAPGQ